MTDTFKTGDIVMLNSGGAAMTVRFVAEERIRRMQDPDASVCTEWLDSTGRLHQQWFRPEQLTKAVRMATYLGEDKGFATSFEFEQPRPIADAQWTDEQIAEITAQGPQPPYELNKLPRFSEEIQAKLAAQDAAYEAEKADVQG